MNPVDTSGVTDKPTASASTKALTAGSTPIEKVVDLASFEAFVKLLGEKCRAGSQTILDARDLIAGVVKVRNVAGFLQREEIDAIIDRHVSDPGRPRYSGTITAARLQKMQFKPPAMILPGLITEGLTILAGKPKMGKSWFTLDLAVAVAQGGTVLGHQLEQGAVLSLCLEDSELRLKTRLNKLVGSASDWPERLAFATKWPRLDEGGLLEIEAWCRAAQNPRLIVIDTLAKIRSSRRSAKAQYDQDYDAMEGLQRLAHRYHLAIVIVHHTRKAAAEYELDSVSGTLGLVGAADCTLIFGRKQSGTVLHAKGRDIEDQDLPLSFDPACCRWIRDETVRVAPSSAARARLFSELDGAEVPLSPSDLMRRANPKNRNALDVMLSKMLADGQIEKVERGKYTIAGKIRKKDPAAAQATETAQIFLAVDNHSDLSPK